MSGRASRSVSSGVRNVTVRSFVESVSVESVRKSRRALLRRHFRGAEARHYAKRPVQSVAAAMALKRAAVQLFATLVGRRRFRHNEFTFSHRVDGSPRLVSFPALGRPSRAYLRNHLHVSATHTKVEAFGLIVYVEEHRA